MTLTASIISKSFTTIIIDSIQQINFVGRLGNLHGLEDLKDNLKNDLDGLDYFDDNLSILYDLDGNFNITSTASINVKIIFNNQHPQ